MGRGWGVVSPSLADKACPDLKGLPASRVAVVTTRLAQHHSTRHTPQHNTTPLSQCLLEVNGGDRYMCVWVLHAVCVEPLLPCPSDVIALTVPLPHLHTESTKKPLLDLSLKDVAVGR